LRGFIILVDYEFNTIIFGGIGAIITFWSIITTIYYSWKRSKVAEELERLEVELQT